jgi:hypothetical protein
MGKATKRRKEEISPKTIQRSRKIQVICQAHGMI